MHGRIVGLGVGGGVSLENVISWIRTNTRVSMGSNYYPTGPTPTSTRSLLLVFLRVRWSEHILYFVFASISTHILFIIEWCINTIQIEFISYLIMNKI